MLERELEVRTLGIFRLWGKCMSCIRGVSLCTVLWATAGAGGKEGTWVLGLKGVIK